MSMLLLSWVPHVRWENPLSHSVVFWSEYPISNSAAVWEVIWPRHNLKLIHHLSSFWTQWQWPASERARSQFRCSRQSKRIHPLSFGAPLFARDQFVYVIGDTFRLCFAHRDWIRRFIGKRWNWVSGSVAKKYSKNFFYSTIFFYSKKKLMNVRSFFAIYFC